MAPRSSAPLNIPVGNSPITPDAPPPREDEQLTGNFVQDIKTGFSRIDLKQDFQNIEKVPCIRTSLLYGIGGGVGLGAIRFLGSRRPRNSANWAVYSFAIIAGVQWQICRRARSRELQQMRMIQEKFPHRHASNLKRTAEERGESKESGG